MKLIATLLLGMASVALGQANRGGEVPPYPGGPAIQLRAPDFSRWTVTVNPKKIPTAAGESSEGEGKEGGAAQKAGFAERTLITKSKAIMHEQVVGSKGALREKWCLGEYQYPLTGAKDARVVPYTKSSFTGAINPARYTDYTVTDFPGFEWITPERYNGLKKVMGRDCIVYSLDGTVAYVSLEHRLPVGLLKADKTLIYEFQSAPQIMLTPPPAVVADYRVRIGAAQ